ncbi:hypothetical protein Tco_0052991 [Tanacetum coccineum]
MKDKKPSKLILPPMDMLEKPFPCVKDVDYITQDLAVSMSDMFCNKIGHRPSNCEINVPQESILRDELATLETTLEDIQLSSESSSI